VKKESPVEVILGIPSMVIAAATAVKLLVDVFEKIWNMPVNRRIVLATADKLEREAPPENPAPTWSIDDGQVSDGGKSLGYYIDRVIRRLEKNPVKMARV
jgi:hypothetical protein